MRISGSEEHTPGNSNHIRRPGNDRTGRGNYRKTQPARKSVGGADRKRELIWNDQAIVSLLLVGTDVTLPSSLACSPMKS